METIICYTDGGSRGNPGPAATGVYVTNAAGTPLLEHKTTLGNATNNFAEYQAVATALEVMKAHFGKKTKDLAFELRLDSELVQKQLSGEYQIREPGLVPLFIEIHNQRVESYPNISFVHLPRDQNKEADRLVNEALDGK